MKLAIISVNNMDGTGPTTHSNDFFYKPNYYCNPIAHPKTELLSMLILAVSFV